jgi:hypothetical protein
VTKKLVNEYIQGGSNMTGTNCDLFTHNQSGSYLNYLVYWLGTGKIFNFLNSLLHEVLGCAPTIILMILFCKVKTFLLLGELPQKIISYFKSENEQSKLT